MEQEVLVLRLLIDARQVSAEWQMHVRHLSKGVRPIGNGNRESACNQSVKSLTCQIDVR